MNTPNAPKEKTLTEWTYKRMREDIVSGNLDPGSKLKISSLRERYDCSSGPLREALSRLVGEFLVKPVEQRGFVVAPVSISDAAEIGEMRIQLERDALIKSIKNGDEVWEERVITTHHRLERVELKSNQGIGELGEWEMRNHLFHEALVSACPSSWLLQIRDVVYKHHERYRRISRIETVLTRDIREEHNQLRDHALNRDLERASETICSHIEKTTAAVIDALKASTH